MFGKAKKNYARISALVPVQKLLDEASKTARDTTKTLSTLEVPEILGAVAGAGSGAALTAGGMAIGAASGTSGAAALTSGLAAAGSIIGGGMAAGIGVAAAPVVVLAVGGYALLERRNRTKLRLQQEALLQEALRKHDAILRQLSESHELTRERLEYLQQLNARLADVIRNLREDLGPEVS